MPNPENDVDSRGSAPRANPVAAPPGINAELFGKRGSGDRLTPDNAALIMIDFNVHLMNAVQTLDQQSLRNNALALAKIGRVFNLPMFFAGDEPEGAPFGPLLPEIRQLAPDATYVRRTHINFFDEPSNYEPVLKSGRTKLIMAGITTDLCLEQAALLAKRSGYDVYVVVDASGTWTKTLEQASLMRMAQAGVHLTNWQTTASELAFDWSSPTAPDVQAIYRDHLGAMGLILGAKGGAAMH